MDVVPDEPRPARRNPPRAKKLAIAASAWRLFLDQGYGGTSMDAIAQMAGVSKATVYSYFGSKDALFTHVVAEEGERPGLLLSKSSESIGIGSVLSQAALDVSKLLLSSDNTAALRMVLSESLNLPGLGARFFKAGPDVLIERLAMRMASAMQCGEMRDAPPRLAAAQFIALITGELQLQMILGVVRAVPTRTRTMVASGGARTFMRAYDIIVPPA